MEAARQGLSRRFERDHGSGTAPESEGPDSRIRPRTAETHGDGNTMRQHENTGEGTGDYRSGERRDHRRARREWQRQQYRDADTDLAGSEEAVPHEPAASGA